MEPTSAPTSTSLLPASVSAGDGPHGYAQRVRRAAEDLAAMTATVRGLRDHLDTLARRTEAAYPRARGALPPLATDPTCPVDGVPLAQLWMLLRAIADYEPGIEHIIRAFVWRPAVFGNYLPPGVDPALSLFQSVGAVEQYASVGRLLDSLASTSFATRAPHVDPLADTCGGATETGFVRR